MTAESFVITQEGTKLTLQGRIDSTNAIELGNKLEQALKGGLTQIVLNMLRVEYLCSTGIRVILKAYKEAQSVGGKLSIEMPSECVKNVLGMVVLNEMLVE